MYLKMRESNHKKPKRKRRRRRKWFRKIIKSRIRRKSRKINCIHSIRIWI